MGIEVVIEGLTKSFGRQTVWRDVTLTLPPGEVSVMLGPSGHRQDGVPQVRWSACSSPSAAGCWSTASTSVNCSERDSSTRSASCSA